MREQIRRYASREERQIGRRDAHLPQGHCFEDTGRRDLHEKKRGGGKGEWRIRDEGRVRARNPDFHPRTPIPSRAISGPRILFSASREDGVGRE